MAKREKTPSDSYRRELEQRLNRDPQFDRELTEFQKSHPS